MVLESFFEQVCRNPFSIQVSSLLNARKSEQVVLASRNPFSIQVSSLSDVITGEFADILLS